jgi:DNA-binding NtrC family response regulator
VLQEREFERLGEQRTRRVNVRVIAATHRDLESEVAARRFRDDLYYRLNVVHLHVPALRERPEDILPLVEFFLGRYNQENFKRVHITDPHVITLFQRYPWPGNVRELQNCIEKAVVLATGEELTLDLLPAAAVSFLQPAAAASRVAAVPGGTGGRAPASLDERVREAAGQADVPDGAAYRHLLARFERPLLVLALERTHGNQLAASRWLGINRNTLRQKLQAHGLLPSATPETAAHEP